jgi:hypothetical protein
MCEPFKSRSTNLDQLYQSERNPALNTAQYKTTW